ncbi:MAG: homoserine O-acetyltransferase/O-succinyltransferase family protein [Blautia marasmi]
MQDLTVLAESDEAGLSCHGRRRPQDFCNGSPEYDRVTLDGEYKRDLGKGLPIEMPENYYRDNNPENGPLLL